MGVSERVVCVWSRETGLAGSGYRVDARRVLTARHVVENAQSCDVRLDGDTKYAPANVVWRGRGNVDIAVLDLGEGLEPRGRDPHWADCRWVDGKCRAAGYPVFLAYQDGPEREEFVGELRPLAGIERGRIHATGNWAGERCPKHWRGMSGAALFSEGHLIGVITEAMPDRLLACPVSKLFEDEEFCNIFQGLRLDTRLWPVADRPAVRQLRPWAKRAPTRDRPPSELLLAHNEVVPFDDSLRVRELELLEEFSRDQGPELLIFTGRGGAGKTRLMVEWCARLRERGWLAGFVESGHPDIARVTEGETPRLLVVDYPEGRVREVAVLCRWMHSAVPSVRLVLLARSRGPWFDELRKEVESNLTTRAHWHELDELDDDQRRRAYRKARAAFSGKTEIAESPDALVRDDLPLFAHMRALVREYGHTQHDDGPEELLALVLSHERKHWSQQLTALLGIRPGDAFLWDLDRVVGALVLFGGADGRLGSLVSWLRPRLDEREREVIAVCIERLYRRGERIMALQPDLLGEQLVFEATTHAVHQHGKAGIEWWLSLPVHELAPPGSMGNTIVVLMRLVDRGVDAARDWLEIFFRAGCERWMIECVRQGDKADPRGHELAGAVRTLGNAELATQLERAELPKATVELLLLRVEVLRVLLDHMAFDDSQGSQSERARLLTAFGIYLLDAGRREEALAATQAAVEILRKLAGVSPDAFVPELARALNGLGNSLFVLGRHEQAKQALLEMVKHCRKLVKANPDTFLSDLAKALNNLGNSLSSLGRREEAMATTAEAVELYRKMAKTRPDAFLPDLATALGNLGADLSSLGRREEAAAATQEAVELYQTLAGANPDGFLPALARVLNSLGSHLSELGKREQATVATEEAVKYYRQLARTNEVAFLPPLAMALTNLGNRLDSLGRRDEAIVVMQEAVAHYRKLAKANSDTFLPDLATALNNLGMGLISLDRREEAMVVMQETVEYFQELADASSEAFLPELAMALTNLGMGLSLSGQREEGLVVIHQAVEYYRKLAKATPDVFLPQLARALYILGWVQRELRAHPTSRESLAEAVRILLPFYRQFRSAHAELLGALTKELRTSCDEGGVAVPEDLREWIEGC